MVCWIRSCHGDHAWIQCPKLAGIRELKGKDWRPSAADREQAQLVAENKALRAHLAQAEGNLASASVAQAGASIAASGGSLAPVGSEEGAQGLPQSSLPEGLDPASIPRPLRLGPRAGLEFVGQRRSRPVQSEQAPPRPDGGGGSPAVL